MSIFKLLNTLGFKFANSNNKQLIDDARTQLDDIGSVFRTTIGNYRSHAENVRLQAKAKQEEVDRLRKLEEEARTAEHDLLAVAYQAEDMASRIENSLGFDMEKAA